MPRRPHHVHARRQRTVSEIQRGFRSWAQCPQLPQLFTHESYSLKRFEVQEFSGEHRLMFTGSNFSDPIRRLGERRHLSGPGWVLIPLRGGGMKERSLRLGGTGVRGSWGTASAPMSLPTSASSPVISVRRLGPSRVRQAGSGGSSVSTGRPGRYRSDSSTRSTRADPVGAFKSPRPLVGRKSLSSADFQNRRDHSYDPGVAGCCRRHPGAR